MDDKSILFFSAATKPEYEIFILPFITFVLERYNTGFVEIIVNDKTKFFNRYHEGLEVLRKYYNNRFLITSNISNVNGSVARFILQPITNCYYTYITDIDIMLLERDIIEKHVRNMQETGQVLSNKCRKRDMLTGCQMVISKPYYEKTIQARKTIRFKSDEQTLFEIVKRSFGDPRKILNDYRPLHGYHLSLKRQPDYIAWKLTPKRFKKEYEITKATKIYKEIYRFFDKKFIDVLNTLEELLNYACKNTVGNII